MDIRTVYIAVPEHGLVLMNLQIRADPQRYQNVVSHGLAQNIEDTRMVC